MRISAAALLLLAGCGGEHEAGAVWGPLTGVLESPTRIEAFRINMPEGKEGAAYTDWPVSSGPVVLDGAIGKELSAILLDPRSYSTAPKPCEPRPGVKVRWWSGARRVEMVFCFECATLWVYSDAGRGVQREFDPAGKRLVAVMKRIFPKDPQIQALK